MNIEDITMQLVDALKASQADYMLVGAIAAMHYGITRSTFDVDAVLGPSGSPAAVARQMGSNYRLEAQQAFEVFTGKHLHVIHAIGTPFKIDLFPLTEDAFDQFRFTRRCRALLRNREVFFPTAEDVIVQKLRWGRNKDLDDARDVMAVQYQSLDWSYIEHWCQVHGTRELLQKIKSVIPPN